MKNIILLVASILAGLTISLPTYANLDTVGVSKVIEHCNYWEAGNNLLEIHFGTQGHYDDVRYYRLPFLNKGTISVGDAYFNSLTNYAIAGCGNAPPSCAINPVGGGSYQAFMGWQVRYPASGGIRKDHNGLNWWPYYSWNDGSTTPLPWNYTRVTEMPDWCAGSGFESVLCGEYYRNSTTVVRFTPGTNGGTTTSPSCYPASCGSANTSELKSVPLTAGSAGLCSQGSASVFSESTDGAGVTHYSWTCQQAGGNPTSCTSAQYKPLCIPTATDGCCDETRSASQCGYSVKNVDKAQPTQDGPLTLSFLKSTADMNNIASECRAPVDGKPRIVCDANPLINISSTLTSFTLPSSVTQAQGNCRVIFDSADTCAKREDTIAFKGVPVKPICPDSTNPDCGVTVDTTNQKVCIQLTDKFKNIVTYADATKVTITGTVGTNSYIKSDTSQYSLGEVTIVDGKFCVPVVPPKPCILGDPLCPVIPPEPPVVVTDTYCVPGWTACPGSSTVTTLTVGIGNPGGSSFTYTPADMATRPSGGVIIKKKSCTGHIEVLDGELWNTDGVMYDTEQLYRIVVDGSNPACTGGVIVLSGGGITATGGTLDSVSPLTLSGGYMTFLAKIMRTDPTVTERHPRGVYVSLMYTEPSGGIRYGLTASDSDFTDSPLLITGDRMKGVRVLGNTLGSNMSMFNHNNGNAIAEQTALITESRNAMIKNVNLLTRGMLDYGTSNKVINGILYKEGNVTYSDIESVNFQTLILKGGDLTIDRDIPEARGVIVIRGDKIDRGNIIVADNVRSVYASIFAEGTFRGDSITAANPNPKVQLVLKGSLFSRNTIGGSADPAALYTSGNATTTDLDAAFVQDLNHVRSDGGGLKYKGYSDPFIIDYDNMQGSPLPGFSN